MSTKCQIGSIYQLEVSFKNEDKNGARFFGRGFACNAANYPAICATGNTVLLMLPEPVDSTIRQIDAKLNYNGEKLKLSGGYYGNFYINNVGSLRANVPAGTTFVDGNGNALGVDNLMNAFLSTPLALWPDSQAHQFYLGGNYAVDPKTKVNFKYSYTHATQHESFNGMGLPAAPGNRDNLGGIRNTTKMQAGFSNRSFTDLNLHGDVSYVTKHNDTPIDNYNTSGAANTNHWTNGASTTQKFDSKLEANYKLPYRMQLVGGVKYESENYGTFTPTDNVNQVLSAIKQKLQTTGYRVELRKTMSEEFSGSIAYVGEKRIGTSPWLKPNALPLNGVFPASANCASVGANACVFSATGAFPFIYEDMNRQKLRATGNWTPIERLSLQATFDTGRDRYMGPTTVGLRDSTMYNVSLDATYQLSDNWKFTGFVNSGNRMAVMGHSTDYDGLAKDISTTFGLGLSGKPLERVRVGADLMVMSDVLAYQIRPDQSISAANYAIFINNGGLPNVTYQLTRLNLYGEYAVNKAATVRLDFIHNRTFFNEWTYNFNGTPFIYGDNTTLSAKQLQSVNFFGASYIYKFQ